MIKPRTTFVLYIIVLIQVYLFLPWKGIFFILTSILFLAHLIYCSANICSQAYIKTLCKGSSNEKKIAITFDDGPHSEITPKVLDLLNEYKVKATFFCIGNQIKENQELIKQIDKKEHLIGNHSWAHERWFDLYPSQKMRDGIEQTNGLIFETIGKRTKLFRPPYGVTNPSLKRAIKGLNFHTIGWSVRSLDTVKNTKQSLKRIKKQLSTGDIILFHDNREQIIEVLRLFLDYAKQNEYHVVPLDELLNIEAYE